MAVKYRPTDYLYISARLRARESGLVGKERLARLLEMKSAEEALDALISEGVLASEAKADTENALTQLWRRELQTVCSAVPDPALLAFLQYPNDCHNIKTALKCHYRGISPDGLWLDVGTVDVAELQELPARIPASLPKNLKDAVMRACVAYEQSGDPREIDFILDAACFADMSESAAPLPIAAELVRIRADLCNLIICRRLLAMDAGETAVRTLAHAFLPGGQIGCEQLAEALTQGDEAFGALLQKSEYAACFAVDSLQEIEHRADDFYMERARAAASVPFGAEVAIGYLVGVEYAVKNLRILLSGKRAQATTDTLKGRLRQSYV